MMKKIIYTFFTLFLTYSAIVAQQTIQPRQLNYTNQGIVYDKEFTIDFRLHTNGLALGFNVGQLKTYYRTRYYHFEIGEIRHPKEYRQSFDLPVRNSSVASRSFLFGKQNNFFVLRAGMGEKRYFSEKARKRGLAVGMSYEGGVSMGILKPYYLQILRYQDTPSGDPSVPRAEKFSEDNAELFLDVDRIYGAAGFGEGLSEISVTPGFHSQVAVHFDWGAFDEFVKAMEAGIMLDFYFKKIPIMIESPSLPNVENRPFFINLFLNFQLGKRR